MKKKVALFFLKILTPFVFPVVVLTLFDTKNTFASEITITGLVKEKGSGKRITDASIINKEKRDQVVNVDDMGYFKIQISNSSNSILIRSDNYYDKTIKITDLDLTKENEIYLELLPDIVGSGIIRAKKKQEISQTNLLQAEVRQTAGTGGDVVRAIQTLPSVSPASVGSANIVVRGGDPGNNKFFYDDLNLPFIFHFGGVNTVIPTKMIDSVDFYPGGYSALYGDATGGIIQLNSKNSVPEKFSGDIEAGLTQSGIYLEGNTAQNKVGFRGGYRRTYYELYTPLINRASNISFFTFPQSTDYQFVFNGKLDNGTWQAYLLGAMDRVGVLGNFGTSNDSSGKNSFNFSQYYETSGTKFNKNLDNGFGLQISFQQLYNKVNQSFSTNKVQASSNIFSLKTALTKNFNENNFLTLGVIPSYEFDKVHVNVPQLPAPGSGSQNFNPNTAPQVETVYNISYPYGNAFIDLNLAPTNKFRINPGVNFLRGNHSQQVAADPRLGVRFEFLPNNILKGAVGYYSQRPGYIYDAQGYGNTSLNLERTIQTVLGYETKIFTDWALDIQGWNKTSRNLVGPAISNPSVNYENSVHFRAYGLDFFLKKQYIGRFYGWLSYSYNKSMKQDPGSGIWRYSNYDRTHIMNLVANAKITNRWLVGSRIQYMTGTPYSSVASGSFNQNTGQYQPANDGKTYLINKNDERFPNFFQIDVRSDYDFLYDNWKLDFYFEINNLTNQKNVQQINYNRDYTQEVNIYAFPILPSIGLIASF